MMPGTSRSGRNLQDSRDRTPFDGGPIKPPLNQDASIAWDSILSGLNARALRRMDVHMLRLAAVLRVMAERYYQLVQADPTDAKLNRLWLAATARFSMVMECFKVDDIDDADDELERWLRS
jgi:hypothetical protein